ncbi:hypothetical protein [Aquimarina sp. RZ0]|uniref:capsular polysaccharide export protein, LipB/KpsS family n=1 Tax=Aquimarina sp. RZ0 TaxID=2607730 RepID=UPI0011F34A54|nr:hypothetical protein [Aquimarina sp. RZ0]KAA1246565.1 hypothetical protein F0000_07325 [Aquimarina sp. RZ0]
MSHIFIKYYRSFIPHNKKTVGDDDWATFEDLLKYCLQKLGYDFNSEVSTSPKNGMPDAIMSAHHSKLTDATSDIFYKQMHLSHLFTIDTNGWGPQHSLMQSIPSFHTVNKQKATQFCKNLSLDFLTKGYSKQKQPPINSLLPTPDDFIFVPLQRPTDVMIKNNSPISVRDFITTVSIWAEKNQRHIVFKLHPGNYMDPEIVVQVEDCCQNSAYVRVLDGNIHGLIKKSKGIMCINSGSGFESLIHGKPVVTFGNCDYRWVTFNATTELLQEASRYIDTYTKTASVIGYQLVYYYYHHHAYSIKEEERTESIERLLNYLKNTLKLIISDREIYDITKEKNII